MNAHQELAKIFAHRNPADVAIEISGFTSWRTTLLEELTIEEAEKLLSIHQPRSDEKKHNELIEEMMRKEWKSAILSLAETTHIKEPKSFEKFNNWMLTKSIFKKHLNAHSLEELKQVHRQLKGVQANNNRSAKRPMNKAWWNKAENNKMWN